MPKNSTPNNVDHPTHYNNHPSGVECIDIKRHLVSDIGDAFKYIWRYSLKGASEQDLRKAIWYITDDWGHTVARVKERPPVGDVIDREPNQTVACIFVLLLRISQSDQPEHVYNLVIRLINSLISDSNPSSVASGVPHLDPHIDHCDLDNL